MFDAVLVANRGEIACRVIRTLRRLGIRSVAVYSDADAGAPHVRAADVAVRIGPAAAAQSYLSIPAVIDAARATGAQAIHPGYGFLSENTAFAAACEEAGIAFVGPPSSAIEAMGDKIRAKQTVAKAGVPVVPGSDETGLDDAALALAVEQVGYPVLLKPSAGGGGKGMHEVHRAEDLATAIATARREARNSFGDATLLVERLVTTPRHIEIQVLADQHGNVIHLGERECSLQRRHQKIIEEAPSPLLTPEQREAMGAAAVEAARAVGYTGAGTVEFIVGGEPGVGGEDLEFFFMEMNTRLQVEHPVTEEVYGVDLVEMQLRVAAGERQPWPVLERVGHAVEARIYAEDPAAGFLPTGGLIRALRLPEGRARRLRCRRRLDGRQRLRPDARQGHRLGAEPRAGPPRARCRAGRHRAARRRHQHRLPPGAARRPRRPGGPPGHRADRPPDRRAGRRRRASRRPPRRGRPRAGRAGAERPGRRPVRRARRLAGRRPRLDDLADGRLGPRRGRGAGARSGRRRRRRDRGRPRPPGRRPARTPMRARHRRPPRPSRAGGAGASTATGSSSRSTGSRAPTPSPRTATPSGWAATAWPGPSASRGPSTPSPPRRPERADPCARPCPAP